MTSIFDQYEQESLQSSKKVKPPTISDLTSQYNLLNIDLEVNNDEIPIFKLSKLKTMPLVTNRLYCMAVGEKVIAFVTVNNILYYLNSENSDKVKEIDINKALGYNCKIKNMFMDPVGGHHILLSVTSNFNLNSSPSSSNSICDLFYLSTSVANFKLKQIYKMRSYEVTAVAWNRLNVMPQSTAPILLGTSKGLIFEIEINSESDKLFQSNIEVYCRQVFDIGKNSSASCITGLEFYKFINTSDRYFILATTVDRLYQFMGQIHNNDERPFLLQIFNNYLNVHEDFIEKPNENKRSQLQICFIKKSDCMGKVYPKSLGWYIDGLGIIYGELKVEWEEGLSNVFVQDQILDYSELPGAVIAFVLTEFHAVLLYNDKVVAISVLNKEPVYVDYCDDSYGKCISMCKDIEGNFFVLSERAIHKAKFYKEDRYIWKIYLDMEQFSSAKKYCNMNMNYLFIVMKKEAEYYFDHEMYEESASLYAKLDGISFDDVALKFLQVKQVEALKLYLLKTLEKLKIQESTQITMITFWLLEIFEKQLADAKFIKGTVNEERKYQKDIESLLSIPAVYNCLKTNKERAYSIMNSHGDTENLITIALMFKDYEKVIRQYLEEGKVHLALNILKEESVSNFQTSLIDSFMLDFISMAPKDTIDLLKSLGNQIDPLTILPNLIFPSNSDYDIESAEVISYLEYCIHSLHLHDEAIHNYLITLYAKYKPEKIMPYLATQGQDPSIINYEIRYALKLCQEIGLIEACVQLSAMLGLWESAVDLALTVSIDLAKQTISQPSTHNVELSKKLWLKIAQHVVNKSNDIKQAMEFLQQCDLIKIEDVLPFFNDFVTIDHFKDAICSSLQEYNQNIEFLKEEMEDATKSADIIRNDIQSFKNRYTVIQATDLCCSCNIQLLLRPFYIFPCSHYFHVDCLIKELKPYLSDSDVNRIEILQYQLTEISPNASNDDGVSLNSSSFSQKDQLKIELDSLIASECFFCGTLTIEQIDKPFIEDDEFERIRSDWL